MILEAQRLRCGYGQVIVLRDVDLGVARGEIVSLVGANGAGKTTFLKAISGIIQPSSGMILFQGEEITNKRPDHIVRAGISHIPEGRQIFAGLTVRQNLVLGSYVRRLKREDLERLLESTFQLFDILKTRLEQKAGTMSGGEQQMLAIARALMAQPRLLLLDEPSLGLAPMVVNSILNAIQDLRSSGISILLVEQNVNAALNISDRAYVLETGAIVTEGDAKDLMNDSQIRKSYLGM